MIEPNTMHLINPGEDPSLGVFHNLIGEDGVCGLGVQRCGQALETACLVVGRQALTQRKIHEKFTEGRIYEEATSLLALYALRPGDIAIDVGAHVGFFSVLFRLCVGPTGAVYAFEPTPDTYQRLANNVAFNQFSNVLPQQVALADQVGTAVFYINQSNEGESSLLATSLGETCQVQVTTLDDVFREGLVARPRVMKIDVEGVELSVLSGGAGFFEMYAPDMVIVEMSKVALEAGGASEGDLRDFFTCRSYRCAVISNRCDLNLGGARFYRYLAPGEESASSDYPFVYNLMFVREGSGLYPDPFY